RSLPLHPELIAAKRVIAAAPNKLRALESEALRLSRVVAGGGMSMPDANDALWECAQTHGLFLTDRQRDDIEHVIREGLAGRRSTVDHVPAPSPVEGKSGGQSPARTKSVVHLKKMSDVQPRPVEWLWVGRLARGKLTMVVGEPALGKSQLTIDIAAR